MKSRIVLGGLAAGIAFFMWGFLYWAASPLSKKVLPPVPGGDAAIAALQSAGATSGAYHFPSDEEMEKSENWDKPYFSILIFRTGHGSNSSGWASPAYDRLLDEAAAIVDPAARLARLRDAEKLVLDEAALAPVVFGARTYLIHPAVKNWDPAPMGIHRYQLVRIEK